MIFRKIPMQIYGEFHKTFSGANTDTFKVCKDCEGMCEYSKIGTLLPGEKEYMAKEMGISVNEFKLRFLDILRFDDGTQLYLLKLGKLCPFLNEETKECECQNFKPIFCKIYPVVFTVKSGDIKFELDNWCKLSRKKAFRSHFEKVIPALSSLPILKEWFIYVSSYDSLCFDYNQLEKYRNGEDIKIFSLGEIVSSEKTRIEIAHIGINLSEGRKELFDTLEIA